MTIIDHRAPIRPGVSAAGVEVGQKYPELLRRALPLPHRRSLLVARVGPVRLYFEREVIREIVLEEGYEGEIEGTRVRIGDTLEHLAALGPICFDEEDNLVVRGLEGISFETTAWRRVGKEWFAAIGANLDARITEMFVAAFYPLGGYVSECVERTGRAIED